MSQELQNAVAGFLDTLDEESRLRRVKKDQIAGIIPMIPAHGIARIALRGHFYEVRRLGDSISVRRKDAIPDDSPAAQTATDPSHAWTRDRLAAHAESVGVSVDSKMTKQDILAAIEGASEHE